MPHGRSVQKNSLEKLLRGGEKTTRRLLTLNLAGPSRPSTKSWEETQRVAIRSELCMSEVDTLYSCPREDWKSPLF